MSLSADLASEVHAILNSSMNLPDTCMCRARVGQGEGIWRGGAVEACGLHVCPHWGRLPVPVYSSVAAAAAVVAARCHASCAATCDRRGAPQQRT